MTKEQLDKLVDRGLITDLTLDAEVLKDMSEAEVLAMYSTMVGVADAPVETPEVEPEAEPSEPVKVDEPATEPEVEPVDDEIVVDELDEDEE